MATSTIKKLSTRWQQTFPAYVQLGVGVAVTTANAVVDITLPCSMPDGNASVTFTNNILFVGNGETNVATAVTSAIIRGNKLRLDVASANPLTEHELYSFMTGTENTMTVTVA